MTFVFADDLFSIPLHHPSLPPIQRVQCILATYLQLGLQHECQYLQSKSPATKASKHVGL